MTTTSKQDRNFLDTVISQRLLEWIQENLDPEEVFSDKQLEDWAIGNGWVQ